MLRSNAINRGLLPTTAQKKFGYLKFLQRRKWDQAHAWNPIHNVISGNRESYFLVSVNVFQVLSLYFNFKLYFWRIIKYDCKSFPLVTQANIQHVLFRVAEPGGEIMCLGRVSSSCSTSGNVHRVRYHINIGRHSWSTFLSLSVTHESPHTILATRDVWKVTKGDQTWVTNNAFLFKFETSSQVITYLFYQCTTPVHFQGGSHFPKRKSTKGQTTIYKTYT
jgi:hypothetical protein